MMLVDGRGAMDKKIAKLKSHDMYELFPPVKGLPSFKLGFVLHRKVQKTVFLGQAGRLR